MWKNQERFHARGLKFGFRQKKKKTKDDKENEGNPLSKEVPTGGQYRTFPVSSDWVSSAEDNGELGRQGTAS